MRLSLGLNLLSLAGFATSQEFSGTCGGVINSEQTIYSPGFDSGLYFNNLNCVWTINLGDIQGFDLIPHVFDLESQTTCGYDSLVISDNAGYEEYFCGSNSRKRRDAENTEKGDPANRDGAVIRSNTGMPTISISGGSATLVFETDGTVTQAGFAIEIQMHQVSCGGVINSEQTIYSPGFDSGLYFNNLNCVWTINLGDIQGFDLIPHVFDLESQTTCGYDSLVISDNAGYEEYFCGSNSRKRRDAVTTIKAKPERRNNEKSSNSGMTTVSISGGFATLVFETDGSVTRAGFALEIRIQDITNPGTINCPNTAWVPNVENTACLPHGVIVDCNSSLITITAHIDHLYGNLPQSRWSSVRLNIGTCSGLSAPDASGWMTETFGLGNCGGELSQSGEIHVYWHARGPAELLMQDGILLSSMLRFTAECSYASELNLMADPLSVTHDLIPTLDPAIVASPSNNTFGNDFQMNFLDDVSSVSIGETVTISIDSSLSFGSFSYIFELTKCTAYDSETKNGLSYEILSDHCTPSTLIEFDHSNIDGGPGNAAEFSFTSFTFSADDQALHLECALKICVQDASGALLDPSCRTSCGWEVAGEALTSGLRCDAPGIPRSQSSRSNGDFYTAPMSVSRIVGGAVVEQGSWPWIVGLNSGSTHWCGGTAITKNSGSNPDWILTAAHCCAGSVSIRVTVGDWSQNTLSNSEVTVISTRIIMHPNYNGGTLSHDYCLIEVPNLTAAGANHQPACLPAEHIQPRRKCYTAGWGTTSSGGSISTNLQAVGLWIFEQDYCSNTGNAGYLDDSMFCAGVPDLDGDGVIDGGKDACQGDSGGPLVCEVDGQPVLYGITSWGFGCAAANYPGVWGSVAYAIDWITETMTT